MAQHIMLYGQGFTWFNGVCQQCVRDLIDAIQSDHDISGFILYNSAGQQVGRDSVPPHVFKALWALAISLRRSRCYHWMALHSPRSTIHAALEMAFHARDVNAGLCLAAAAHYDNCDIDVGVIIGANMHDPKSWICNLNSPEQDSACRYAKTMVSVLLDAQLYKPNGQHILATDVDIARVCKLGLVWDVVKAKAARRLNTFAAAIAMVLMWRAWVRHIMRPDGAWAARKSREWAKII